jgi:DNA-binding HxlR family transcriptional regulator
MPSSASRNESKSTGTLAATGTSSTEEEEIVRQFREFREAAVRLAERVRDLSVNESDPVAAARADLHMVRSIFGKWSSDVLIALHSLPSAGFEELRRNLDGISPRVLSLKLKELEQSGMLRREILDAHPPRVRYSLTERGWTVAWLSQPVLLYLRFTDPNRQEGAGTEAESSELTPLPSTAPGSRQREEAPSLAFAAAPTRTRARPGRAPARAGFEAIDA